jgi:PAS domain S-box-containing protein
MGEPPPSPASRYVAALALTGLAIAMRWLLDPALGERLAFVMLPAAVAGAAWFGGVGPGALAAAAGWVVSDYLFVAPRGALTPPDARGLAGLAAYLVACAIVVALAEAMRRAQRRTLAGSELLRITLASIGDAVITTDAEGRVTYLNGVAEALTGWPRSDAAGRPLAAVFRIVNEQTRAALGDPVAVVLREGRVVGLANHTVLIARDGTERPIDDSAAPIRDAASRVVGVVLVFRDVTARRRVERMQHDLQAELERQVAVRTAALRTSEERFRLLVDGTQDYAIFMVDPAGHVASWNPGAERIKQYRASEIIGRHIACFYPPEDVAAGRVARALEIAAAEGRYAEEGWRVRKDGSRFWASVVLTALRDEAGALRGFSKVTRDVSERREAEDTARRLAEERAARREAERSARVIATQREELRVTLTSIGDAVLTTDAEGRVTLLNPVAEALTGWSTADAAGQPLARVFPIVNEATRRPVDDPVAKVLATGRVQGLANHTVLIARDGTERPIDDSAAPILGMNGEILGCVLIFRDVSERRRLERELSERLEAARLLAAIVESSHDAIVSKTLDGTIRTWNASAARMFGYPAEEAVGRHISLIIPPDRRAEETTIIARLCAGERVDELETVRVRKDGGLVDVSLTISPIRDPAGRVVGASKIARDIGDRKRWERALRDADRRKDEFLATLAHELRNPLAPIRHAVQVFGLEGRPPTELRWAHDVVERQVRHMARLLDDLLDVSRISHGKLELRRERIELSAVFQAAVETSRPLIDAARHELVATLPEEPIHLDADGVRLAQVVSNLLNNAARYTPAGGTIWLAGERSGDEVVVTVRDDGTGIDAEMLPRIFDMFSQGSGAPEGAPGGLGIGLSLVRGVVELHGGRVEARSEGPGRGSEFVVRLPGAAPDAVREAPAPEPRRDERPRTSRRVLIADDLRDSADTLAVLLRMAGHDAHTAYDGAEAVARAAEVRPDVVLLDLGMPLLSGYEACRQIRAEPWGRGIFLVALTGWGQEDDRRRTEEAGFDRHLVKPVDPDALLALLDGLADRDEAVA